MFAQVHRLMALCVLTLAAACTNIDPNGELVPLGDFRLGHNIVIARDVQKGPFSREATKDELSDALAAAIEERFVRYDGNGLYHFGISIGGYVLAQPGLPVVYTPKSVMIFDVTLYDNATGQKLNEKPQRITAFEGLQNTAPIVGSGLTRDKTAQLRNLTQEGARLIQDWLKQNDEWFIPDPDAPRTEFDRDTEEARALDAGLAALN